MVLGKFTVNKFAVEKLVSGIFDAVKFCTPSIYPPPCTLSSTVHCPVHLHIEPASSVYTAFRLLGENFLRQTCLRRILWTRITIDN